MINILLAGGAGAVPAEEWRKRFWGSDNDEAFSAQQTSDDGYVIAGYTKSYGAGKYDMLLIKTDMNGGMQWSRTFGGKDNDYAYSAVQTKDDGYIIAGKTESYGEGYEDIWLIKTVQQTSDNGYIIAGATLSYWVGWMSGL